jgi:hypothetical protein
MATTPNATQVEYRRPTKGLLPLRKMAARMAMFGDWLQHEDFRYYRSVANRLS